MYRPIVDFALLRQIRVDHDSNGGGAVCDIGGISRGPHSESIQCLPGNLMGLQSRAAASLATCVLFPALSSPSTTMNAPLMSSCLPAFLSLPRSRVAQRQLFLAEPSSSRCLVRAPHLTLKHVESRRIFSFLQLASKPLTRQAGQRDRQANPVSISGRRLACLYYTPRSATRGSHTSISTRHSKSLHTLLATARYLHHKIIHSATYQLRGICEVSASVCRDTRRRERIYMLTAWCLVVFSL
jgi:hypothetical protein